MGTSRDCEVNKMGFGLSVGGFFDFLLRPFTNPIGWIMLLGAGVWIYLRITGKVGGFGKRKDRGGGGGGADYVID